MNQSGEAVDDVRSVVVVVVVYSVIILLYRIEYRIWRIIQDECYS